MPVLAMSARAAAVGPKATRDSTWSVGVHVSGAFAVFAVFAMASAIVGEIVVTRRYRRVEVGPDGPKVLAGAGQAERGVGVAGEHRRQGADAQPLLHDLTADVERVVEPGDVALVEVGGRMQRRPPAVHA